MDGWMEGYAGDSTLLSHIQMPKRSVNQHSNMKRTLETAAKQKPHRLELNAGPSDWQVRYNGSMALFHVTFVQAIPNRQGHDNGAINAGDHRILKEINLS